MISNEQALQALCLAQQAELATLRPAAEWALQRKPNANFSDGALNIEIPTREGRRLHLQFATHGMNLTAKSSAMCEAIRLRIDPLCTTFQENSNGIWIHDRNGPNGYGGTLYVGFGGLHFFYYSALMTKSQILFRESHYVTEETLGEFTRALRDAIKEWGLAP